MERDQRIRKLVKEAGVTKAPGDFTGKVMHRIKLQSRGAVYRPLIGRTGRILILLFIAGIVAATVLFADNGSTSELWDWSGIELNLDFLKALNPAPWLVSTVVALFLLVLSDAGIRRKRMT